MYLEHWQIMHNLRWRGDCVLDSLYQTQKQQSQMAAGTTTATTINRAEKEQQQHLLVTTWQQKQQQSTSGGKSNNHPVVTTAAAANGREKPATPMNWRRKTATTIDGDKWQQNLSQLQKQPLSTGGEKAATPNQQWPHVAAITATG